VWEYGHIQDQNIHEKHSKNFRQYCFIWSAEHGITVHHEYQFILFYIDMYCYHIRQDNHEFLKLINNKRAVLYTLVKRKVTFPK
jgi:hypothetical protein